MTLGELADKLTNLAASLDDLRGGESFMYAFGHADPHAERVARYRLYQAADKLREAADVIAATIKEEA